MRPQTVGSPVELSAEEHAARCRLRAPGETRRIEVGRGNACLDGQSTHRTGIRALIDIGTESRRRPLRSRPERRDQVGPCLHVCVGERGIRGALSGYGTINVRGWGACRAG